MGKMKEKNDNLWRRVRPDMNSWAFHPQEGEGRKKGGQGRKYSTHLLIGLLPGKIIGI